MPEQLPIPPWPETRFVAVPRQGMFLGHCEYRFEVYLRYLAQELYSEYEIIILVIIEAPAIVLDSRVLSSFQVPKRQILQSQIKGPAAQHGALREKPSMMRRRTDMCHHNTEAEQLPKLVRSSNLQRHPFKFYCSKIIDPASKVQA